MGNETLAQFPTDFSDPIQVRNFVTSLVTYIDNLALVRGQNRIALVEDLLVESKALREAVTVLQNEVDYLITLLEP